MDRGFVVEGIYRVVNKALYQQFQSRMMELDDTHEEVRVYALVTPLQTPLFYDIHQQYSFCVHVDKTHTV